MGRHPLRGGGDTRSADGTRYVGSVVFSNAAIDHGHAAAELLVRLANQAAVPDSHRVAVAGEVQPQRATHLDMIGVRRVGGIPVIRSSNSQLARCRAGGQKLHLRSAQFDQTVRSVDEPQFIGGRVADHWCHRQGALRYRRATASTPLAPFRSLKHAGRRGQETPVLQEFESQLAPSPRPPLVGRFAMSCRGAGELTAAAGGCGAHRHFSDVREHFSIVGRKSGISSAPPEYTSLSSPHQLKRTNRPENVRTAGMTLAGSRFNPQPIRSSRDGTREPRGYRLRRSEFIVGLRARGPCRPRISVPR